MMNGVGGEVDSGEGNLLTDKVSLPAWFLTGHVRSLAYGLRSAAFRSIEDRKTWMMIFKNIHAAFLSRESWMAWHGECV
jgi:hypothetical protein